MTIADIIQRYKSTLIKVYDSAEARTIITMVLEKELQLNALRLEMNKYLLLTTHQQEILEKYLERLVNHEPVQYILGEADFMDMKFNVNPHVLIPRPETEDLVRWIIESVGQDFSGTILDIGTGSGCIAVALKKLLPNADVSACDICSNALYTATENALRNETEINFFRLDVLLEKLPSQYDIIVSNPPYVPTKAVKLLEPELAFEPQMALDGGPDGLSIVRRLVSEAPAFLASGGRLLTEIGWDQGPRVEALLKDARFSSVRILKDLEEKDRIASGVFIGPV